MLVNFGNKYVREKKYGKTIIVNRYIKYIIPVGSSAATGIAYKLAMLLIKRRNFLVKESGSVLYETNVC